MKVLLCRMFASFFIVFLAFSKSASLMSIFTRGRMSPLAMATRIQQKFSFRLHTIEKLNECNRSLRFFTPSLNITSKRRSIEKSMMIHNE